MWKLREKQNPVGLVADQTPKSIFSEGFRAGSRYGLSIASYICDEKPYQPKLKTARTIADKVYNNIKLIFNSFSSPPTNTMSRLIVTKDIPKEKLVKDDNH